MEEELLSRQLPHSLEAEQSVLGSMLIDSRCVAEVIGMLRPDDFFLQQNKEIYETIYTMFNFSETIDPVTVLDKLKQHGLGSDKTASYLMQLMEITPTAANVAQYAAIVKDKAMMRNLAVAAGDIRETVFEGVGTAAEIMENAEKKIYALRSGNTGDSLQPLGVVMINVFERLEELANSDQAFPGVTTGLQEFCTDNVIMEPLGDVQREVVGQDVFIDHLLPKNFGRISVTACGKLYRRGIFENLRFPEGKIYEDLHVYLSVLLSCQKIAILSASLYYYYRNPNSITRSNYLAHDRFGEFQVREGYIHFFKERGLPNQVHYAENDYLTFFMRNYFAVTLRYRQRKAAMDSHVKVFKTHLKGILSNPYVCKMRKICAVGMLICPRTFYPVARRCIPDCLIEEMR